MVQDDHIILSPLPRVSSRNLQAVDVISARANALTREFIAENQGQDGLLTAWLTHCCFVFASCYWDFSGSLLHPFSFCSAAFCVDQFLEH
jgi:hypothetical protein